MEYLNSEYSLFIEEMLSRSFKIGIDLRKYSIDHVCYRTANSDQFNRYFDVFKELSVMYTTKQFHGRKFHSFFLKEPFEFDGVASFMVEFSEPGGSDTYEIGFQHLELATKLELSYLITNKKMAKDLVFEGKYGDEIYLKWPDKKVIKIASTPLSYKQTAEEGSKITVI